MIKSIKRNIDPDYLFIEPFELVVTEEMLTALAMATRDIRYEIGPMIALINALDFEYNWRERRQTIVNHINNAKAVAITHADAVGDPQHLTTIIDLVKMNIDNAVVFPLSVPDGTGVDTLMKVVTR